MYAVADGIQIPEVKPNPKLRSYLAKLSTSELFEMLQKKDPVRATTIEPKNPRRLVRAREIIDATGKPVSEAAATPPPYSTLFIGIKKSPEELKDRIHKRLHKRLNQGMLQEVEWLHRNGMSWKRFEELGLEYKYIAQYFQGKITKLEMIDLIQKDSESFVRRQMLWFKRDSRIHWVETQTQAEDALKSFIEPS